jgi:serine phosphatase RsbU (regulator of sigma subunit)
MTAHAAGRRLVRPILPAAFCPLPFPDRIDRVLRRPLVDQNARRFAHWVLAIHLALLLAVVAVVLLGSRAVYQSGREQAIVQAQSRQSLLAGQTARGIESFYRSLLSVLDLLKGAEEVELAAAAAAEPGRPPPAGPDPRSGVLATFISRELWPHLQGRVTHLFAIDRDPFRVVRQFVEPGGLPVSDIVAAEGRWLESVDRPTVSSFVPVGGPAVGGGPVSLLAVPVDGPQRRLLVAVVSARTVDAQFLNDVNIQRTMRASLLDERAVVMLSADQTSIGMDVIRDGLDPRLRDAVRGHMAAGKPGTELFEEDMAVGDRVLRSQVTSLHPIDVADKRWWLVIASGFTEIDQVVNTLWRRLAFWATFMIIAMTAILISTSVQLIRGRSRLESVRREMIEKDLAQARQIQLAWLPGRRQRRPAAADIEAVNQPASHISGDFYNWFDLADGRTVVTIGDVTGHGMAAAFFMATTQLLVRTTMQRVADPGRCLTEVNQLLCQQGYSGQFVTIMVIVLDPANGVMEIASAGQGGPLVGRDDGSFETLPVQPQLVLAVEEDLDYPTERYPLEGGACMLLYTDGATDVLSPTGERFSLEALRRGLAGRFDTARSLLDAAVEAIDTFRGGTELTDDLTLVAVQVRPVPAARVEPPRPAGVGHGSDGA